MDAERRAGAVGRWQCGNPARPADPATEAWAAVLRAVLCWRGAEQMRADADEAVRRFTAANITTPSPVTMRGIAQVLCGDLDASDQFLEDRASIAGDLGAPDDLAGALCERSLLAMTRGDWSRAEAMAGQARTALRRAGIEECYLTPLVCAVQARAALRSKTAPFRGGSRCRGRGSGPRESAAQRGRMVVADGVVPHPAGGPPRVVLGFRVPPGGAGFPSAAAASAARRPGGS